MGSKTFFYKYTHRANIIKSKSAKSKENLCHIFQKVNGYTSVV